MKPFYHLASLLLSLGSHLKTEAGPTPELLPRSSLPPRQTSKYRPLSHPYALNFKLLFRHVRPCKQRRGWERRGPNSKHHHFEAPSHLALSPAAPTLPSPIAPFVPLNLNFKLTGPLASFLPVSVLAITSPTSQRAPGLLLS